MDVQFPLFVFEKDDRSMFFVESRERVLNSLEAIDIQNGEYLFWDSTGASVCVSVARGAIDQIELCNQAMTLPQAFAAYARAYGLQMSLAQSPVDTWRSLQTQLPPRKTLWARLFRRGYKELVRFSRLTGHNRGLSVGLKPSSVIWCQISL